MWFLCSAELIWGYNQEEGCVKECAYLHHGVLLYVSVIRSTETLHQGAPEQKYAKNQRPELHGALVLEARYITLAIPYRDLLDCTEQKSVILLFIYCPSLQKISSQSANHLCP